MKSIFKKIALLLSLVMVVTLFPVNTASAAEDNDLPQVKAKRVLYIGGDKTGTYVESSAEGPMGLVTAWCVVNGKGVAPSTQG